MKKIIIMSLLLGSASVAIAQATNGNPNGVSTQAGSTGSSTQGGTGTMQQDRPSKAVTTPSAPSVGKASPAGANAKATSGSGRKNKAVQEKKMSTSKKSTSGDRHR